jgi:hypothetical protein
MSAAQIESMGGGINGALYVEHPLSSTMTLAREAPLPKRAESTPEFRSERWWEDEHRGPKLQSV